MKELSSIHFACTRPCSSRSKLWRLLTPPPTSACVDASSCGGGAFSPEPFAFVDSLACTTTSCRRWTADCSHSFCGAPVSITISSISAVSSSCSSVGSLTEVSRVAMRARIVRRSCTSSSAYAVSAKNFLWASVGSETGSNPFASITTRKASLKATHRASRLSLKTCGLITMRGPPCCCAAVSETGVSETGVSGPDASPPLESERVLPPLVARWTPEGSCPPPRGLPIGVVVWDSRITGCPGMNRLSGGTPPAAAAARASLAAWSRKRSALPTGCVVS